MKGKSISRSQLSLETLYKASMSWLQQEFVVSLLSIDGAMVHLLALSADVHGPQRSKGGHALVS